MPLHHEQLNVMIRALQARHAKPDPDAVRTAMATWVRLTDTFSTLIGRHGVALIFERSLSQVWQQFHWLRAAQPAEAAADPMTPLFAALQSAFARQTRDNAMAANGALLAAFITLLANLIGAGITAQYLRTIAADADPAGDAPQSQENI